MKTIKVSSYRHNREKTEFYAIGLNSEHIHLKNVILVSTTLIAKMKPGRLGATIHEISYKTTPDSTEQTVQTKKET